MIASLKKLKTEWFQNNIQSILNIKKAIPNGIAFFIAIFFNLLLILIFIRITLIKFCLVRF